MKKAGIADPKPDFLKYVARLSSPQTYDPAHPRLGLTQWEYDMCAAFYDSASPAAELLATKGALPYRHVADVPDYFAELPEDKAPKGRVLVPKDAIPSMSDGGLVAVRTMSTKARQEGIGIRTGMRVTKVPAGQVRPRDRRRSEGRARCHGAPARPQGRDLRHRRLHPQRRAAQELPERPDLRRLRGAQQRGRLRETSPARWARSCAT